MEAAGLKKFKQLRTELGPVMDKDPARAIEEARLLPDTVDDEFFAGLKASIFVDAGSYIKGKQAMIKTKADFLSRHC